MKNPIQLSLSEIERRRKISEAMRGENNPNYGKKRPEETRRKISEANRGENHHYYGKKLSEEHRHKMSVAKRGKKNSKEHRRKISEANRGEKNPNYGKNPSDETRRKMSEANRGKKNPSWKGGISFDSYCYLFNYRKKERTRNQHHRVCIKCGKSALQNEQRLCVDHVDENKEQGCNGHKWQLVPLCKSCHSEMNNTQKHLLFSLLLLKNKKTEINMEAG